MERSGLAWPDLAVVWPARAASPAGERPQVPGALRRGSSGARGPRSKDSPAPRRDGARPCQSGWASATLKNSSSVAESITSITESERLHPFAADEEPVGVAERRGSLARYGHPGPLSAHGQRHPLVVTLRLHDLVTIWNPQPALIADDLPGLVAGQMPWPGKRAARRPGGYARLMTTPPELSLPEWTVSDRLEPAARARLRGRGAHRPAGRVGPGLADPPPDHLPGDRAGWPRPG